MKWVLTSKVINKDNSVDRNLFKLAVGVEVRVFSACWCTDVSSISGFGLVSAEVCSFSTSYSAQFLLFLFIFRSLFVKDEC